jgi:hypothetical protein
MRHRPSFCRCSVFEISLWTPRLRIASTAWSQSSNADSSAALYPFTCTIPTFFSRKWQRSKIPCAGVALLAHIISFLDANVHILADFDALKWQIRTTICFCVPARNNGRVTRKLFLPRHGDRLSIGSCMIAAARSDDGEVTIEENLECGRGCADHPEVCLQRCPHPSGVGIPGNIIRIFCRISLTKALMIGTGLQ